MSVRGATCVCQTERAAHCALGFVRLGDEISRDVRESGE